MSPPSAFDSPLHSSLEDDPDLEELVALYIEEMPGRIECVLGRAAAGDFDALAAIAHQLRGSAGSHGFHQLTGVAADVERAIRDCRPETEIAAALDALVELCRRVCHR